MSENLLPCPFCGKPAEARWLPINGSVKKEIFGLCGCNPCDVTFFSQTKFVEGQEKEALSQAIAAWNRRVPPQGGQPAKCPECGSNMTRFGSSDMCGPETITFFNECRRCKKVYPVVQPAEPVEGAPALERLIFLLLRHAPDSGITQVETAIVAARAEAANREQQMKLSNLDWAEAHTYAQKKAKELGVPESKVDGDSYGVPAIEDLIDMIAEQAANRRPATGEDERVAVLLSRLDAVCCILAIVDGSMPTKQELGMAYDELVSVRDDVAGIIRHLPAPSHSDVEPDKEYAGWSRADLIHRINSIAIVASFQGNAHRWNKGSDGDLLVEIQELAALNGDSK